MGGLKGHTRYHSLASAEPSSAARCEKICASTSFCLCIRNSNVPSPGTSGIAPPADKDRCKREEREIRETATTIRSFVPASSRSAGPSHKYFKVTRNLQPPTHENTWRETYAFFSSFIPFEFMVESVSNITSNNHAYKACQRFRSARSQSIAIAFVHVSDLACDRMF